MDKIKLDIPQTISITRSYTHKLVPENHGIEGHRFAPMDFFASYNHDNIPLEEATPERLKEESNRLYELAKKDVEESYKTRLEELKAPKGLTQDELDGIVPFTTLIISGSKAEAQKMISEEKANLSERQLEFLRNLFRVF